MLSEQFVKFKTNNIVIKYFHISYCLKETGLENINK